MMTREDATHTTIMNWFKAALPPEWLVVHVPNSPRSKIAGARLKKLGMLAGFPDLMILGPGRRVYFAEVKCEGDWTGQRTNLTGNQKQVHSALRALDHQPAVLRSIEDAQAFAVAQRLPIRIIPLGGKGHGSGESDCDANRGERRGGDRARHDRTNRCRVVRPKQA